MISLRHLHTPRHLSLPSLFPSLRLLACRPLNQSLAALRNNQGSLVQKQSIVLATGSLMVSSVMPLVVGSNIVP